ncbi:Lrp/AsnC family transcriptional regulator [Candidatus Geothermarchaeota archaeon]|nr:MAG: Lrp/AsnC family transcriptional regulator [Candidatus Geothermarchaeota archaeon]
MTLAFVLINTELGAEDEIKKKLLEIPEVEEAHAVYGVYDIIAKVRAENLEKIKEVITWKIRRMDKVRSTLTMIVTEE